MLATEPIYEEAYDNGSLVSEASYLFMGGKRIARVEGGKISYYFIDHLGSTRIVMDSAGKSTYNEYAPFGADFGEDTGERYKFTGKEDDGATGLQYFNARYYDPAIGRFVSKDSAKDGVNWYVFCYNNPLFYVEKNGLKPAHCSDVLQKSKYITVVDFNQKTGKVIYVANLVFSLLYKIDLQGKCLAGMMLFTDLMMFLGIKEKADERVVKYDQRSAFLHDANADAEALKQIIYLWRTNPEIALEVLGEEQYWEVRRIFETKLGILEKEIEINFEYDKKEVEKNKKAFEMYTTEEFVDDRPLYID